MWLSWLTFVNAKGLLFVVFFFGTILFVAFSATLYDYHSLLGHKAYILVCEPKSLLNSTTHIETHIFFMSSIVSGT